MNNEDGAMKVVKGCIGGLLALYLTGCTWVQVSAQGEKVRVLAAAEVAECKRLGKTTVTTAGKVAGMERYADKIQAELHTLARNSAVDLGGDTVVPLDVPVDGRQLYGVYRCMPR
jgi:starvation-inducible outer membrane lipoprotein